jgi:hypothetical protein
LARRRASEAEAGLRRGRDVGDAADCDIETREGNGAIGNDTRGSRAQAESGLRVRPSGRTRVSSPASDASCLSGEPHAEVANETVRGLAVPP